MHVDYFLNPHFCGETYNQFRLPSLVSPFWHAPENKESCRAHCVTSRGISLPIFQFCFVDIFLPLSLTTTVETAVNIRDFAARWSQTTVWYRLQNVSSQKASQAAATRCEIHLLFFLPNFAQPFCPPVIFR